MHSAPCCGTNPHGQSLTTEEIDARDHHVRHAYQHQRDQIGSNNRRRNQTCWLCTERRTCTRSSAGCECDHCQALK